MAKTRGGGSQPYGRTKLITSVHRGDCRASSNVVVSDPDLPEGFLKGPSDYSLLVTYLL